MLQEKKEKKKSQTNARCFYFKMESEIIEIAQGHLSAISAITELCKEFGEETVLYTIIPAIKSKKIKGRQLGELFYVTCKGQAMVCGVNICPLLKVYEKRNPNPLPLPDLKPNN